MVMFCVKISHWKTRKPLILELMYKFYIAKNFMIVWEKSNYKSMKEFREKNIYREFNYGNLILLFHSQTLYVGKDVLSIKDHQVLISYKRSIIRDAKKLGIKGFTTDDLKLRVF